MIQALLQKFKVRGILGLMPPHDFHKGLSDAVCLQLSANVGGCCLPSIVINSSSLLLHLQTYAPFKNNEKREARVLRIVGGRPNGASAASPTLYRDACTHTPLCLRTVSPVHSMLVGEGSVCRKRKIHMRAKICV